jgi:hypothetical protein
MAGSQRNHHTGTRFRTEFRPPTTASILCSVDTVRAITFRVPHQARPGRAVLVVTDLADLRGPATGTIELPLPLCWDRPDPSFNLDDPDMREWMYEIVFREASQPEDLLTHLDRGTLIAPLAAPAAAQRRELRLGRAAPGPACRRGCLMPVSNVHRQVAWHGPAGRKPTPVRPRWRQRLDRARHR